jgi:ribosomal protein L10
MPNRLRHRSSPPDICLSLHRDGRFVASRRRGCLNLGQGLALAEQEYGMDRSQKADLVAELKNVFSETSVVVITRNLGMTVAQSTDLRLKMRDAGAQFKVAKNRLALIALEGTKYGPIGDMLTGPTALATSIDPVAAAKVAVDFAKTNDRLEIVGARRASLARRAAREAGGPYPGAGEQDRSHGGGTGRATRARLRGLRKRSLIFATS